MSVDSHQVNLDEMKRRAEHLKSEARAKQIGQKALAVVYGNRTPEDSFSNPSYRDDSLFIQVTTARRNEVSGLHIEWNGAKVYEESRFVGPTSYFSGEWEQHLEELYQADKVRRNREEAEDLSRRFSVF